MLYKHKQLMESGKDREAGDLMKMVTHTLQCMARGGIHDHVGGGFHRYSVDECWHGCFHLPVTLCISFPGTALLFHKGKFHVYPSNTSKLCTPSPPLKFIITHVPF